MLEEIKYYKKEYVFDSYSRIVEDFKDYEKITKVNMLKEILKVYSDCQNIIDICTGRELKYLKMLLEKKIMAHESKYEWEQKMLQKKVNMFVTTRYPEELEEKYGKLIMGKFERCINSVDVVEKDNVMKFGNCHEYPKLCMCQHLCCFVEYSKRY